MEHDVLIDMLASLSLDSGMATSSADPGTVALVDSTKSWPVDKLKYCIVRIVQGKGTGQQVRVAGNSADTLLVTPPWGAGLDTSSAYVIYQPEVSEQVDRSLAGINVLQDRLTAARASLLNNLSELTAARAGYLDNIDNEDLASVIRDVEQATGTFSFDETDGGEQTAFTLAVAARARIGGIWLDLVNVTRDTTIRVKHRIDGASYRTFETNIWETTDEDGVLVTGFTAYRDVQVSLQCDGGGGAAVNVPYAVV